ncbi:hypothetical protein MLD38_007604 [Melastoma candidum]|uniref:Uncharacterized protein n=1 Tax=Melastoma candidum TaxID=119954 RepID=A0ACB9RRL5_9MYRT|nr:hypothetical protein MLD38_007604 [Melastoma candidum]
MARHFVFPHRLQSLEDDPGDDNRLLASNPVDFSSFRPSQLEEFVKEVSFDLSDQEIFCVEEQDAFDRVYSLVRCFSSLTPSCKYNIVESLRSNFSVLLPNIDLLGRQEEEDGVVLDRVISYRNAFKVYTFFLLSIVDIEESNVGSNTASKVTGTARKKPPQNSWNWESQRARILNLIANSLEMNLSLLFGAPVPDENYLSFIAKSTFCMFENAALLKDMEAKDALCRMVGAVTTKYHFIEHSCASIMHLLHKYDFTVSHMAEAVEKAEAKYADGSLGSSLIREIGRTNSKDYAKDTVGAENIGRFLVELADRMPKLTSTNIGLIVPHFGGESYKIRSALVGVLGKLIVKAFKDVEGEVSSMSVRLRTKQAMLEILLERCRDVSAYTRSRVLQVWAELCEEHSISIGLWNEVAAVAAGRLEDKSSIVRKSALHLLTMMLQHNPFGPHLREASFEATLMQYKKKLSELEPESNKQSDQHGLALGDDTCNGDGEIDEVELDVAPKDPGDSLPDSCFSQAEDVADKDSCLPDFGSLEQTRALVASLEAGLRFSKCVSAMMPTLAQLMASSSASDVENTILLLMRCRQFQIDGSDACLRKMFPLVFSKDKSIYEAVENAFITIYTTKNPVESAKNLVALAVDSTIGDLAALELIIAALVTKGHIIASMISALWDFFCFNVNGVTAEQSRGALSVLCMAAKSSHGILGSHVQDIIDIGFGRWAKVDSLLARTACTAIQRLCESEEDKKKLLSSNGTRLFGILASLISGFSLPEKMWYAAADKAIDVIYTLHPMPETVAADLIRTAVKSVFDNNGGGEQDEGTETYGVDHVMEIQVAKLSKFLFIVSHVAMRQLVYIESCVRKIRKQRAKREREAAQQENGAVPAETPREHGINAELGLAASEDALLDSLAEKAENEIVSGSFTSKNLIGACAPFLSKLCRNFVFLQKYSDLQTSAMLALCRFMIIDSNFCDANLQLLFTVAENAPSDVVRSNCVIALGDLAVRFPNLLEPWTEHMYARLKDPSLSVRKHAVLVLSHLILNDMMKVKGYINEMAARIDDEDERIASLGKLFFNELSKKGSNPIYNLLPDILSKLSSQRLKRESFCNIMQFLIGSIKKDKQMEALVEKLCHRFGGVTDVEQWEHISYCLSQLSFTEKGHKKLIELLKTYEHILWDDSVMDHFKSIINKGRKFAKPELRVCLDEFEEKINKIHLQKKEQEVTAKNARAHQANVAGYDNITANGHHEAEKVDRARRDDKVIDPSVKEEMPALPHDCPEPSNEQEESSIAFSEVTESEVGDMVADQSPTVSSGGEASTFCSRRANCKELHEQEEISEGSKGEEE